jgi:DNA gyrase/topoisomerase IV subunit B
MYIGSVVPDTLDTFVLDGDRIVKRNITYVPGLYKTFDELVVNAVDHSVRMAGRVGKEGFPDAKPVKNIKVSIDRASGVIEVTNDGDGLDVAMHPEHNVYVPEMLFGQMLSGSNFDDTEERVVGGQNGIGAKACNIFGVSFTVNTVDHRRGKLYAQTFRDNMSVTEPPKITSNKRLPFTSVRWLPDYARFGLEGLTDDVYALFAKRVHDICAVTDAGVSVTFNDDKIACKSFERYADMYLGAKSDRERFYEASGPWEVVVAPNVDGSAFEQVSFVNGIACMKGGRHVEHVVNAIVKPLVELIEKRKNLVVKPQFIKDNLIVFIKATIVNPTFDSQTKDTLTTPIPKFGSRFEASEKLVDKIYKSTIVARVLDRASQQTAKEAKKSDGKKSTRIRGLVKLEDANWAGSSKSGQCSLVLCEGDSAKSLCLSGLSVVGRDSYGVFPLRGKLLNVKDVSAKKIVENEEISSLKKIIGLETGKAYDSVDDLRYGRIVVMTDQDSVAADTPVLVRRPASDGRPAGPLEIRRIDDLVASWTDADAKQHASVEYEVWTERGFTRIVRVMRHRVNKRLFRVATTTGLVTVTEDHSLLKPDATEVRPEDVYAGSPLLHSFPILDENRVSVPDDLESRSMFPYLHDLAGNAGLHVYLSASKNSMIGAIRKYQAAPGIALESYISVGDPEAFAMGVFFVTGRCCAADVFDIETEDAQLLDKVAAIWTRVYPDLVFAVDGGRLVASSENDAAIVQLTDKYVSLFGTDADSRPVPTAILNAPRSTRSAFAAGIAAASSFDADFVDFTDLGASGTLCAQSLFFLFKSLGFNVEVDDYPDRADTYVLTVYAGRTVRDPDVVRRITDLGVQSATVYDLETENHHFQAGVGQLIVHNTDGSHCKGLIMNMLHGLWPTLLQTPGFVTSLMTPILKATKGGRVVSFYSAVEFERWRAANEDGRGWTIKYYKGLGTSTDEEGKEYFKNMHLVSYDFKGDECDRALDLAFNKKRADDRKRWLGEYNPDDAIVFGENATEEHVTYKDFIDRDLIHFSVYDVRRSIPSVVDGLKPSQRKIMYCCFKRNLTSEIKVAQLAGYVSENAAYHHGEASLQGAIICMAQDYVGSNNVNLLRPNGMFGSRRMGGKDAASPRYIFTMLEKITQKLYRKDDAPLLDYIDDDGQVVEPTFYVPILPMVLLNGACGIGTGFSTSIPCFNPLDVIDAVERLIAAGGDPTVLDGLDLTPWYRGFKGTFTRAAKGDAFISHGIWSATSDRTVEITELPIGTWSEDYKEFLEGYMDKNPKVLRDYETHYTNNVVRFVLHFHAGELQRLTATFDKEFRIAGSPLTTSNMHLFDTKGTIRKYANVTEILTDFYDIRSFFYAARKAAMVDRIEREVRRITARAQFIDDVCGGRIVVSNQRKAAVEARLVELDYPKDEESYNYLLNMAIHSLTEERRAELMKEIGDRNADLEMYRNTSVDSIWREELADVRADYVKNLESYEKRLSNDAAAVSKTNKKARRA